MKPKYKVIAIVSVLMLVFGIFYLKADDLPTITAANEAEKKDETKIVIYQPSPTETETYIQINQGENVFLFKAK
jgi:ethanolamine utilization microcompartment shell protein EutL